jgi:hypothetical protein
MTSLSYTILTHEGKVLSAKTYVEAQQIVRENLGCKVVAHYEKMPDEVKKLPLTPKQEANRVKACFA